MCACPRRPAFLLLLGAVLASSAGCAYVRDRYRDALDMLDIGLTISKKPEFSAFKACTGLTCIGYGDLDGYFIGLGGGKLGMAKYTSKSVGYGLWGSYQNELTGPGEPADGSTPTGTPEQTGLLAGIEGKSTDVACVQQLHLGWTGIVFNIKWAEILDFVVGWTTADICKDDGVERQGWFASKAVEVAQKPGTEPGDTLSLAPETKTQVDSADTTKPTLPASLSLVSDSPPTGAAAPAEAEHPAARPNETLSDTLGPPLGNARDVASTQAAGAREDALPNPTAPKPSDTARVLALARAALAFADQVMLQCVDDEPHATTKSEIATAPMGWVTGPSGPLYVVQKGDIGLMQIARTQLGNAADWRKIAELNDLQPPYIIRPGEVLRLPD